MFRLILFDIDGTLISTDGAGVKAFARVFDEIYDLPNATKYMTFAGRTDRRLVREIFEANDIELTDQNFRKFNESYFEHLTRYLPEGQTEPLPGVRQIIAAFQKLNPPPVIGLLTGNHPRGAELKLNHYNLWHEFALGAFGHHHEERADVARDALKQGQSQIHNLQSDQILVIGDTKRDIECARAIGAKVLAVATGPYTASELHSLKPDWVVNDLTQIHPSNLTK